MIHTLTVRVVTSLVIAIAALAAMPAEADEFTGAQLYTLCTESKETVQHTACLAYVRGVTDGLFMAQAMQEQRVRSCFPKDSPIDPVQARLIVEKYMRNNPEQLDRGAIVVAFTALATAFPCGATGKR
jgi:hypothetical protein